MYTKIIFSGTLQPQSIKNLITLFEFLTLFKVPEGVTATITIFFASAQAGAKRQALFFQVNLFHKSKFMAGTGSQPFQADELNKAVLFIRGELIKVDPQNETLVYPKF